MRDAVSGRLDSNWRRGNHSNRGIPEVVGTGPWEGLRGWTGFLSERSRGWAGQRGGAPCGGWGHGAELPAVGGARPQKGRAACGGEPVLLRGLCGLEISSANPGFTGVEGSVTSESRRGPVCVFDRSSLVVSGPVSRKGPS